MDEELKKQLAVWISLNYIKGTPQEAYIDLTVYLAGGCTARMREKEVGSDEDARRKMKEKLASAEAQLKFWQERPTDTNARFFRMKYKAVRW